MATRKLIKPAHLKPGDHVAVVAPASAPAHPEAIDGAAAALGQLGFQPVLAPNVRRRLGFLAGTDRQRAGDLMWAFSSGRIRAVLCLRGGYGTGRLLPLLDYETIRQHPKVLVGYSDVTCLLSAVLVKAGLVSFHGPMVASDLAKADLPAFTRDSFTRTVMQSEPPGSICQGYPKKTVQVFRGGVASGRLVGGNLSILCASLATPYAPSFKNAILFLEELNEDPYRVDRMLTQLLNAGLLQQVAGIAIGVNRGCKDPEARNRRGPRQGLEEVFRDRLLPLGVPVVAGLPFGHVRLIATLPIGIQAVLDGDQADLVVRESAVV